jgi:outer membrane protein OmpA-like peptidoglycan-associated protein
MRFKHLLLAATAAAIPLALVPQAARAQPVNGFYVGAGLGVNIMQQNSTTQNRAFSPLPGLNITANGSGNLKSEVGPAGVLSAGWGFGNGLRVELEGNYSANKFNSANGSGSASLNGVPVAFGGTVNTAGGWEQKFGGMVNAFYDFTTLSPWVVPFVGVGIGYEGVSFHGVTISGTDTVGGSIHDALNNSTQGSFAYQAMLGAAFPIPAAPGLSITAEYRFMGLAGTRNYSSTSTVGLGGPLLITDSGTTKVSSDYNHAVLIGLRYAFGVAPAPAPAPTPMAAPAPAPARSYLVFFDWDKATLTPRAQQIIHEAADNSTKVKYTAIEVNGYTDTSGTPQYNQGLSIRRAQAVAAELVKDGVPKGAISIQGFGETHLLVPTGPGVREPQNRRVEIIIR